MSLNELRQASSQGAKPTGMRQQNNTFGLVLEVATAEEISVDGKQSLVLTGKPVSASSRVTSDEIVKVVFRPDGVRALTNYTKGNGRSALATPEKSRGTFVSLENCYVLPEQQDGMTVLNARWLNTVVALNKGDHDKRGFVEDLMATAPRIIFNNPTPQAGEPKSITLPVNAAKIAARVNVDGQGAMREFSKEWAVGKLKELPPNSKPQVVIDTIEPSKATKVESMDEMKAALRQHLGRGSKAVAMIRVGDETELATRLVYVPFKKDGDDYKPDVDKALEDLFAYNVIRGVGNEQLASALDSGNLFAEVIPGYRMTYSGDPTRDDNAAYKLINDVCSGATKRFEVIFGSEPDHYANVILTGIAHNENVDGFSPINFIQADPENYAPDMVPTPHMRIPQAAIETSATIEDGQDAEAADEDEARPKP